MPFKSLAQARMAFATKKPWAKEWASKTNFSSLPQHKGSLKERAKMSIGGKMKINKRWRKNRERVV
jgi:hypothetical protein